LIHEAELTASFVAETGADSDFADFWDVAVRWSEQSRYAVFQEQDAHGLYTAVSQSEHGVLQWLRRHW
jgi:cephalosporin-C deacetylase-like acetyl esterase